MLEVEPVVRVVSPVSWRGRNGNRVEVVASTDSEAFARWRNLTDWCRLAA